MSTLASTVAGVAGFGLLLAATSANPANLANPANPAHAAGNRGSAWALGAPSRTALPAARQVRRRFTPSCSSGSEGNFAFDSSLTFALSPKGSASFGQTNFSAAGDSGVFEGVGSTICDFDSAIVAGFENVVDSGSGNAPSAGEDSVIVGGQSNTISNQNAFVGAGSSNTVSGSVSFVGAGSNNAVSGHEGFVGAGFGNEVSGAGSFVGAGGVLKAGVPNNQIAGEDSFIGAGDSNLVSSTSTEGFVGAGFGNQVSGEGSFIGAGGVLDAGNPNNQVFGEDSFIGAGDKNSASNNESFVGAGVSNSVTGGEAFVGAGFGNLVSGQGSFIGGGGVSTAGTPNNEVTGMDSFIGDGNQNSVQTNGAFVGAGELNAIFGSGTNAAISSGFGNAASNVDASIGGGSGNSVSGAYGTIPGGEDDTVRGFLGFAAGYHAEAVHAGTFVWSDYVSGSKTISDSVKNEFVVRASGGTAFFSNEAGTSGVRLAAGGGSWASVSDRNAKTAIASLDDGTVLAKVAALPVSTWQYKSERGVRHVGPMAQDFYAAFGVGEDDRHITSIDEDGVALAAIKALAREVRELRAENRRMASQLVKLEKH